MAIKRKAFLKWMLIVLFCGAHSAFWGFVAKASPVAMVAGLFTLIIFFAWIESHPRYQAARGKDAVLAKALDWGIRIRIAVAILIPINFIFSASSLPDSLRFLSLPYMAETLIGDYATQICTFLTGIKIDLSGTNTGFGSDTYTNFISSYLTTLITGLIHTAILALICGLVYITMRLRRQSRG